MPKLKDFTKSDFITANIDVRSGDRIVFVDGGTPDTNQQGKPVLTFTLRLPDGEEKKMTVNKTSLRSLAKMWNNNDPDPDTDEWVGKVAEVSVVSQNVMGELKDVIYLKPTGEEGNLDDIPVIDPEDDGKVKKDVSKSSAGKKVESKK